jgi:hypothetical protein
LVPVQEISDLVYDPFGASRIGRVLLGGGRHDSIEADSILS